MENFILYEQLSKNDSCALYKGRRKNTIKFLAMKCADKYKKGEIANMVRLIHEIKHDNIVEFYEWYETADHLWLMFELCTGGSLELLIQQDANLPENCIKEFGIDLADGLYHVHSLEIIYSDLQPSKILVSGTGHLKLSDFGLSRLENENLDEVFATFSDADDIDNKKLKEDQPPLFPDIPEQMKNLGNPRYLAPEVMNGGKHTYASDLWSLGCILYEMFSGYPPFLAETFKQLNEKVSSQELPQPNSPHGSPSAELMNLLQGLLQKNPNSRITWPKLLVHPFWEGGLLNHLQPHPPTSESCGLVLSQSQETLKNNIRQSIVSFKVFKESGRRQDEDDGCNVETGRDDDEDGDDDDAATLKESTRLKEGDDRDLADCNALSTRSNFKFHEHETARDFEDIKAKRFDAGPEVTETFNLVFHFSDFQSTGITNPRKDTLKISSFKYDSKVLPIVPLDVEKIDNENVDKHLKSVLSCLSSFLGCKGGPVPQKFVQLLNYIGCISFKSPLVCDHLISLQVLSHLAKLSKDTNQVEMKFKLCHVINTIVCRATELNPDADLSEVFSCLVDTAREHSKNQKFKTLYLATIGELLCLIAKQENDLETPGGLWLVPPTVYSFINKCLAEGEDLVSNLYSARIIANVASFAGHHTQRFLTVDICNNLWSMFLHGSSEFVKVAAISALCRLSRHSLALPLNLFDKYGVTQYLHATTISSNIKIQQHGITLLVLLLTSDFKPTKWLQDKEMLSNLLRMLDSPSSVVKAKVYLGMLELVKSSNDQLLTACQNKFLACIEKDLKRTSSDGSSSIIDYLQNCLRVVVNNLLDIIPLVFNEVLSSFEMIQGKKHLTPMQQKQFKSSLSMLQITQHFINSSVFRARVVSKSFLRSLSKLYELLVVVDSSVIQLPIVLGSPSYDEFIQTVFGCSEFIVLHCNIVDDNVDIVINNILPHLVCLITRSSGDLRCMSLRFFCEICITFLSDNKMPTKPLSKCLDRVLESFLPYFEQILLEEEPCSSHALRLLHEVMEHRPAFIKDIEQTNLAAVLFQIVCDHQHNLLCGPVKQVVSILKCLVSNRETNFKHLFQLGFSQFLCFIFLETSSFSLQNQYQQQEETKVAIVSDAVDLCNRLLSELLDLLHLLMKRVSEVVRGALEAKKVAQTEAADTAEAKNLLFLNKDFVPFITPLTQLLSHKDEDISEESLKCLGLLIQFYGGENPESLSIKNQVCYNEYLKKNDIKKQKIVLRLIKRLVSTREEHALTMLQTNTQLLNTIQDIAGDNSLRVDVNLSSIAKGILQIIKKPV